MIFRTEFKENNFKRDLCLEVAKKLFQSFNIFSSYLSLSLSLSLVNKQYKAEYKFGHVIIT